MKILNHLVNRYKEHKDKVAQQKQKQINKMHFEKLLLEAAKDGKLTQHEIEDLESKRKEYEITDEDFNRIKLSAYLSAFDSIKSDSRISPDEESELQNIQSYFGLTDDNVKRTQFGLWKYKILYEIDQGNLPSRAVENIVLRKKEQVYWTELSNLVEEKVLRRGYQGGSQGVSFRIAKGVSYRVGSSRGQLITETGMVDVSFGYLIITNKRVIFSGDSKSFDIKLDKILNIQLYSDGIEISEANKAKSRIIKFENTDTHEIAGAILTYAINNFEI